MQITPKQWKVLLTIVRANADGSFLDMDQMLEKLPYKTSKESMQFTIRALIKKELVEKRSKELRRGRVRVILAPTVTGYQVVNGITSLPTG